MSTPTPEWGISDEIAGQMLTAIARIKSEAESHGIVEMTANEGDVRDLGDEPDFAIDPQMLVKGDAPALDTAFEQLEEFVRARAAADPLDNMDTKFADLRIAQNRLATAVQHDEIPSAYLEAFNSAFAIATRQRIRQDWIEISERRTTQEGRAKP